MAGILYSIEKKNRRDKYQHEAKKMPSTEYEINILTANFMQELVTEVGSVLFDKSYGTTFLSDIAKQVNIYKIRYLLDNEYLSTKSKYGILSIETRDVFFDPKDGFLNIDMTLLFESFKSMTKASFVYNGTFTTKTIIEVQ